jgi:hypothetical protein
MTDAGAPFDAVSGARWVARLREAMRAETPPTERELAAQLGVTRHALRWTLARLRDAGEAPPSPRRPISRQLDAATALLAQDTNLFRSWKYGSRRSQHRAVCRAARHADRHRADRRFCAHAAGLRHRHHRPHLSHGRGVGRAEWPRRFALKRPATAGCGRAQPAAARRPWRLCWGSPPARDTEHSAVAGAIAARDADGAEATMRAHLQAVSRTLTGLCCTNKLTVRVPLSLDSLILRLQ